MGRPSKQGLDYFPFDIDFFEDEKIGAISGEFGIKGEITAIKLLCAVYRNGYYVVWNDLLKMKLLKALPGISPELLEQIVNRLVRWGLYDQSLFSLEKILTSASIQRRFFEITKRRKSSDELPYLLINACNNGVNVCNNSISAGNSTQSKVKESKITLSPTRVGSLFPSDEIFEKPLTECYEEISSNQSWVETICMNTRITHKSFTVERFHELLKHFFRKCANEGLKTKSPQDAMSHFARWLDLELKNEKQNNDRGRTTTIKPSASYSNGQQTASKAREDRQHHTDAPKDYSGSF